MPETFDPSSQSLAVTTVLDQSKDSHIDQLQQAAIGPVSADYYRPILSRFETYDRGSPSWNWAASLCTLNWMVFRGMWMPALAYLGGLMLALVALFMVTRLAAPMAPSVEWGLWAAWATLAFLVPGFFGNTWLFNHYRLRLTHALSATPTVQDACRLLGQQASSRRRLVLLVVANVVLAGLVAAIWLWPGTPRHDSARVDHGEVLVAALPSVVPASQAASTPTEDAKTVQSTAGAAISTPGNVTEEPPSTTVASTASTTSTPLASAPPTSAMPATSATAPAAAVSAATATSKAAKSPASVQAAADAGIRHAAIAARSRKAHQERSEPVVAATPPTAQKVAPAAAVQKAAETAVPAPSYLVNVGLFAQDDNARRAFDRLRAAGLPAITQDLQRGDNTLTRVRVGPFDSREQADAAAVKIRALQLDAVVTRP